MTPTTRCAGLLAAVAIAGLLLPVWLAIAGALALLATTLADGLAVRAAPPLRRDVEEVLSRGVAAKLSVRALARDSRRMLLRQPATPALRVRARPAARELHAELLPLSRGRQRLPGVAAASLGPLGLARWQHPAGAPADLLVYPDLVGARRLVLRLRQGRAAPGGRLRRGPLGLGTEFEAIREYSPDDDIRQVNWRASARLGRPMSNEHRVEQDQEVVCLLDCGRLMAAPIASGTLLDAALDALTAVALAADELGDRCGALAFDGDVRRAVSPRRLGGRRVVQALFDVQPTLTDSDFERAFMGVGGTRRGLVLVLTDVIDVHAARSLVRAAPMLARRHALVVAGVADPSLEPAVASAEQPGRAPVGPAVELETPGVGPAVELEAAAAQLAALSVLRAREETVTRIRRAGAQVVLSSPSALPERCVQAYLRAKGRARL